MSEMVERVARAICSARGFDPDFDYDPKGKTDEPMIRWMGWRVEARAAIEAMRDPTEAMITARDKATDCLSGNCPGEWQDMIDEALK